MLLIEPVWNRNFPSVAVYVKVALLLIEPVWNRKRSQITTSSAALLTFNRTSMESKLISLGAMLSSRLSLLIEPVWNRNTTLATRFRYTGAFNRTSMESKHKFNASSFSRTLSFNRTSMESKQRIESAVRYESELLIEPVWNRNRGSPMVGLRKKWVF